MKLAIIIGRGHGGTRAASFTLSRSGFFMGRIHKESGDTMPLLGFMFQAVRLAGQYVTCKGDCRWDISKLVSSEPPPLYTVRVKRYLKPILGSRLERVGWKLPETLLALPWLVQLFPDAYYIYWTRKKKASISKPHFTDDLTRWNVPCTRPKDEQEKRIESWKYQRYILNHTPKPKRVCKVAFEDFVLDQKRTLARLSRFLGEPLVRIPVKREWGR